MPDIQFMHLRDRRDRTDGIEIQAMPTMAFHAERDNEFRRFPDPCQFCRAAAFIMAVTAGMKLDNVGADGSRSRGRGRGRRCWWWQQW